MKKYLLLLLLLVSSLFTLLAQIQFNNTYDAGLVSRNVFQMADSGYVMLGGLEIDNLVNINVTKYDAEGTYQWSKIYGDDTYHTYHGSENACIKTEGGYILAAGVQLPNQDTNMIYVIKFNEQFDTLWTRKHFIDNSWVTSRGICNTDDGGFMVVGETQLSNDSTIVGVGYLKGLMLKLDSLGQYQWFKSFGTDEHNDYLYKVVQTHDGGYLMGGATDSWQDNLEWIDQGDWYLVKTDSLGNEEFYRRYGNTTLRDGRITDIIRASDSTYYLTGSKTYNSNSTGSTLWKESYIVKLDQDFNTINHITNDNQAYYQTYPWDALELEDGNIMLLERKVTIESYPRARLTKMTPSGSIIWQREYVTQNDTLMNRSYGLSLKRTNDGGFIIGGYCSLPGETPYQQLWMVKTDSMGCDGTADFRDCFSVGTYVQSACNSYTWMDGISYSESNNTAYVVLPDAAVSGMDSLVTLDLTIYGSDTTYDAHSACESFTWLDGNTYTENNQTASVTYTNQLGCDSTAILDLSILNPSSSVDQQQACYSYTWIDGITYTESNNTASYILENAVGCDSIIHLDLSIDTNTTSIDYQTACFSYTWIDGNTYSESNNTASFTLSNAAGCDSVVSLDLIIYPEFSSIDIRTECQGYIWIDGVTYTEDNNTATHTLSSVNGCDSIITLDLSIDQVNTSITVNDPSITANVIEVDYQWLDCNTEYSPILNATEQTFTAQSNGLYAVEITQNSCVDTSDCVQITTVNIDELQNSVSFRLYPNPADHFVVVSSCTSTTLSNQKVESLAIYDITGKQVKSITFKEASETQRFDISDLEEGVYMVKVGAYVRKLVVSK